MTKSDETRQQWLRDLSLGLRDEFNLSENDALNRASSLMDRMSQVLPAGTYYWPGADKAKRNQEILRSLSKMSMHEVSKKFHISEKRVYSIRSSAMKKRDQQRIAQEVPVKPLSGKI